MVFNFIRGFLKSNPALTLSKEDAIIWFSMPPYIPRKPSQMPGANGLVYTFPEDKFGFFISNLQTVQNFFIGHLTAHSIQRMVHIQKYIQLSRVMHHDEGLIVIGSLAYGASREDSDIDLIFVGDCKGDHPKKIEEDLSRYLAKNEILGKKNKPIEVNIVTRLEKANLDKVFRGEHYSSELVELYKSHFFGVPLKDYSRYILAVERLRTVDFHLESELRFPQLPQFTKLTASLCKYNQKRIDDAIAENKEATENKEKIDPTKVIPPEILEAENAMLSFFGQTMPRFQHHQRKMGP